MWRLLGTFLCGSILALPCAAQNPTITLTVPVPLGKELADGLGKALTEAVGNVPERQGEPPPVGIGETMFPRNSVFTIRADATPWKQKAGQSEGRVLDVVAAGVVMIAGGRKQWVDPAQLVKLDDVIAQLDAQLAETPHDADRLLALSCLQAYLGRHDRAIAALTTLIQLHPKQPAYLHLRARENLEIGERDSALNDFSRLIALGSPSALALLQRGKLFLAMAKPDEALTDLDACIRLDPECSDGFAHRAAIQLNAGKFDAAQADCTESLRLNPEAIMGLRVRAAIHREQNRTEQAIADFTEIIKLNDKEQFAYLERGWIRLELGEKEAARADLLQAAKLPCDGIEQLVKLAASLHMLHEEGPAKEALRQAIRLSTKTHRDHLYRGYAYLSLDRIDDAIAEYSRILETSPSDAQVRMQRAKCYAKQGKSKLALDDLAVVIAANPQDRALRKLRLGLWSGRADWEDAVAELSTAIERDPKDSEALVARGVVWAKQTQYAKAIRDLLAAAEADPENDHACTALAALLFSCPDAELRSPESSMHWLLKLLRMPAEPDWEFVTGMIDSFAHEGEFERALKLQTAVLERKDLSEDFRQQQVARLQSLTAQAAARLEGGPRQTFPKPQFPGAAPASERFGDAKSANPATADKPR